MARWPRGIAFVSPSLPQHDVSNLSWMSDERLTISLFLMSEVVDKVVFDVCSESWTSAKAAKGSCSLGMKKQTSPLSQGGMNAFEKRVVRVLKLGQRQDVLRVYKSSIA
jgi:hypothetical protein